MDLSNVKNINIPEGSVKKITANGVTFWEKPISFINLAEPNDTNTTDWNIWINNARMGSDGGYRSNATSMLTNFIELIPGEPATYYFSGMDIPENGFPSSIVGPGLQAAYFRAGKSLEKYWLGGKNFAGFKSASDVFGDYINYTTNSNGFVTSMSLGDIWVSQAHAFTQGPYYLRIALPNTIDKSKIIITKNQPIE